jgi:hypothetical protein
MIVNKYTIKDPGYDPDKDFVPVALLNRAPYMLLANPALPINSVPDLVTYTRSDPGKAFLAYEGSSIQAIPNNRPALLRQKGQPRPAPFSPRLDAGVDFYFLAFFAFFFFAIVSSFCSDIGKSEACQEPINAPNPFNSKSRELFHTMVNKIDALS